MRANETYSEAKLSLVIETEMFLLTISPLISGGPLLSLRCLARFHHCLRSLVRVVDCCVSRLVKLICNWIILTASSPGRLLIYRSPVIHQLVLPPFVFRSSEVRRLLLDLDPYGGTDPLGMFHLFLKRTANVMASRLIVVFLRFIRLGSFPACWRQANLIPIPKSPPSSSIANYRPIAITSVLSKVFERLVSVCLGWLLERSGMLPTTQFAYQKGLGTCDALLFVFHTVQSASESGQEARIVQIDFSAVFDRVNHMGILYKLCSVGIRGSVLSILIQFLSNRSQQVMLDGCRSKMVNVVSGVPLGSVLGPLLFLCTLRSFFPFWKIS